MEMSGAIYELEERLKYRIFIKITKNPVRKNSNTYMNRIKRFYGELCRHRHDCIIKKFVS